MYLCIISFCSHGVFWLWDAMGTHLTFSTRMTELGWSHGSDLLACTLYMPPGRALSGSCTAGIWGVWELFWACLQLENKEERMTKGLQWKYSHCWRMHMWCCLAVLHPQTSVCPRKSQSSCLHVFVLLFGSLTCPLSRFLYYFIAVSESCPLPPPLSRFFSFSFFSIPSSLPLPIFACATFNCSDMPCGKLCLCVLEQALLVMAVVPDVRGGV